MHFTPTYGSWINLVERWFAEITNKRIRRGVFRSVKELEAAIREYIAVHNEDPKPFVWTRTADQILASIARFAQRTGTVQPLNLCHEPLGQETSRAILKYHNARYSTGTANRCLER